MPVLAVTSSLGHRVKANFTPGTNKLQNNLSIKANLEIKSSIGHRKGKMENKLKKKNITSRKLILEMSVSAVHILFKYCIINQKYCLTMVK